MKKILIAGGTGMIGRYLEKKLVNEGYEVRIFTRHPKEAHHFKCDYQKSLIDDTAWTGVDVLINLAGANVGEKRWTADYKKEIYDSRIQTTALLRDSLQRSNHRLELYIGASATGIYKNTENDTVNESYTTGNDFLATVCKDWEKESLLMDKFTNRLAILRIGVVMTHLGGFIPRVIMPIKYGVGAALGNGKQWMPWIHLDDLCNIFIYTIKENKMRGIYNACAPGAIQNKEMMQVMAKSIHRKILLPAVPSWVLKLLFGEFSAELLACKKVVPERLLQEGFVFNKSKFEDAIKE